MEKRTLIIAPDGTEMVFDGALPTYGQQKETVGGWIEIVRVLRQDITDSNVYTLMIVNDEGRISGLPRNQKATDLYLANVRRQYPDAENPSVAANNAFMARCKERGVPVINLNAPAVDPNICGTVIYFEGWTESELVEAGL